MLTNFYSVETPSVFREYELPVNDADWTPQHRQQWAELLDLAERYETTILTTPHRRG